MRYNNDLEGKIADLERELRVAQLNNWEFDIANLKDEIREAEQELENSIREAWDI